MPRQAAARLVAPHVASGQRVWVSSQWGLYWYGQKAGAQVLRSDDVPAPGDYLVRGGMEGYAGTLKRLPPAVQIATLNGGGAGGRTLDGKDGAGLYTHWLGGLVWAGGYGGVDH